MRHKVPDAEEPGRGEKTEGEVRERRVTVERGRR